ncbi:hypothetical protein NQ315_010808 [Exocentrus adspersus]|uniref:Uncharacterized protein n=1 Tax=Exocentrus adspersus TaxID=1586481 RepID=A0AAV8V9H7_9CUCU|nr:hypothetical protein NQ315_010808 [Exocentrus adspersus]
MYFYNSTLVEEEFLYLSYTILSTECGCRGEFWENKTAPPIHTMTQKVAESAMNVCSPKGNKHLRTLQDCPDLKQNYFLLINLEFCGLNFQFPHTAFLHDTTVYLCVPT